MSPRLLFVVVGCLLASVTSAAELPTSITFDSASARVGDRVDQSIELQVQLKARIRRGAEILEESDSTVNRAHQRVVTTTEVKEGRSIAVKVAYGEATDEAIAGKTYHCRRDGEQLRITDERGAIPTLAEYEIVARHMEMVGKSNPLAGFLRGKTISVEQSLDVPREVAVALFGAKKLNDVEHFRLTLVEVVEVSGRTAGRFKADIQVVGTDGAQTRMELAGPMTVLASSGRVLSTKMLGPIAMNHSRNDPGGRLQVSATGRFTVSLQAEFQDAAIARTGRSWFR